MKPSKRKMVLLVTGVCILASFFIIPVLGALYDPSEQSLVPIDAIRTTEHIFAGIPYWLKSGSSYWAWDSKLKSFWLSQHSNVNGSVFYFVLNSWGYDGKDYYYLRNAATGSANFIIRCNASTSPSVNNLECYMMPTSESLENAQYGFDPVLSVYTLSRRIDNHKQNHYVLVPSTSGPVGRGNLLFQYGINSSTGILVQDEILDFDFEVICKTIRHIVEINLTTRPVEVLDGYFRKTTKQRRETIINPTAVSKEKRIKESLTVSTKREVRFSDSGSTQLLGHVEKVTNAVVDPIPPVLSQENALTIHGGVDVTNVKTSDSSNGTENARVVEIEEVILIPAFTCVEVIFLTENGQQMKQNFTASIRVSAQITRFDTANGYLIHGQWAPGKVIPQFLRDLGEQAGELVDIQETSAIYQDDGEIVTTNGVQTYFLVEEIPCRNANTRDAYGNLKQPPK